MKTSLVDDPRVQADKYIVRPSNYDALTMSDKDHWCLSVVNGHEWGWAVRRGADANSYSAMNRKGEFILERRGSRLNRFRRYSLEEALSLALRYVDSLTINGFTAEAASEHMRKQIEARGEQP